MNGDAKKTGRLSFRTPPVFEDALEQLVADSSWTRTDIGLFGLMVFWPDIRSMAIATKPKENPTPQDFEEMREMARLFKQAQAYKVNVRALLTDAVEAKIAEQAIATTPAKSAAN